ncbi:MAG: AmmeMemoRadiSam system radical SAM enzyme [Archaeoglobaceae archaeon]
MKDSQLHQAEVFTRRNRAITCNLCWNRCEIGEDEMGLCNTRVNKHGSLYTLTYGNLSALESRPIELKPFHHFLPSSTSMTFSTYSCNLKCPWCQNRHISRKPPSRQYDRIEPREVVDAALGAALGEKDPSICASFNEPTLLFEYLLDLFPLAAKNGLKNTMVSNGYMMPQPLKRLIEGGMDAINFDIKNERSCYHGGSTEISKVWRNVKYAVKEGVHVEVVKLLVTGIDDNRQTIEEVIEDHLTYAGSEVPLHFTRYFPAFMYQEPPTRVDVLENAVKTAREKGVEFAYIGNVSGHKYENTYCPQCSELLIHRHSHNILQNKIQDGKCPQCRKTLYGIWNR